MTKLSQIAKVLGGELQGEDIDVSTYSTNTARIIEGGLFIALKGVRRDAHAFVDKAKKNGAAAILVHRPVETTLPVVMVSDSHKALLKLADWHRTQFELPLAAVTGSCGKTTVKEMISSILSQCGPTLATIGNYNNYIGLPLSLLRIDDTHRFGVIEVGANHPGEVQELSKMVKPLVAVVNNVAPAHLEGFESVQGIADAKAEIFQSLTKEGTAVINADDDYVDYYRDLLKDQKTISFGIENPADVTVTEMPKVFTPKISFTMKTPKGDIDINLSLAGKHNMKNALAATAVTQAMGVSLEDIKAGLESTQAVPGRMNFKKGKNGSLIIDDTYNASPLAVTAALNVLAQYSGERVFVMGDFAEMGDSVIGYHTQVGKEAKSLGIERVYTCGKLSRNTSEAFGTGAIHFGEHAELAAMLEEQLQENVTVLVKGSRSAKMEKVVEALLMEAKK